ncbi:protein zntC isoform X1 [Copidosoma floridanum]|uniref:protein zntC isoform X1 n=1 Tax=Copidosoma floridanum TaxID=29053 RepID=UPI0006C97906|nr:protein zntC isoform X1 [Copidosoma floridanum]XP_014210986.1 protein zntC isoform X1 [Copidosoma floridanum]XP_014210996.1 protein zntC isoform X1 [Copidosoma floridanum]XP_014211005.1 protein zntC isoform X1 [Copidosoma floridanum]XP_014211013.1 protein zntC isoform X1 [Copidosoma floridanum]XP_014211021.1 protein zntC isoform X1 [Copidosoma floridanum]XP_014211030.1 protein zntC isoform X1 [Copidosoma floridanum]XP_014211035.1 protein zntC isoform X1 [Copidosoma floridanum]
MDVPVVTTTPTSSDVSPATILLVSKIGSMFVLGLGSLLLGTLPLMIGRCRAKKCEKSISRRAIGSSVSSASTTLTTGSIVTASSGSSAQPADSSQGLLTSLLLCFGGGVLLFTTFLHLAPEVRESVELHQASGRLLSLGSLSLAELLFCGGFFLVYLVEEAVHAALSGKPESSDALLYRTVSVRRCNHATSPAHHYNHNNGGGGGSSSSAQPVPVRAWRLSEGSEADEERCPASKHGDRPVFVAAVAPIRHNDHYHDRPLSQRGHLPGCEEAGLKPRANEPKPNGAGNKQTRPHDNSMRSLLTVLALSFHAIFEGLAVGLEPAMSSVLYLAAAIATHKLVISFCVGMELYVAGASRRAILGYLSVFSMVTPLGIAIGLGLGQFRDVGAGDETLGPVSTILQGMAAGTLLYVVFFEVLARERANDKSGLLQLAAIFVGFMLMLGLQLVTAHSHGGHDHGTNHTHHTHPETLTS